MVLSLVIGLLIINCQYNLNYKLKSLLIQLLKPQTSIVTQLSNFIIYQFLKGQMLGHDVQIVISQVFRILGSTQKYIYYT